MPKVSVIIPLYNAEKHLRRCCKSLFEQTLDDIEYIFVNDGSKDHSVQIVKEVLEENPNRKQSAIIIDRKINKGVSYTRQEGVNRASGDYIIHCDSDDWVEKEAYEVLYNEAITNDADIICCGFTKESANEQKTHIKYNTPSFFSPLIFNIAPKTGSLWNKLIKRSLLIKNDIKFPIGINWGEDFCVVISCLIVSKKTICLNQCFYHYCENGTSITHTPSKRKVLELISVGKVVENFVKRQEDADSYTYQLNYLKFQLKSRLLRCPETRDIRLWKSTYSECHRDITKYKTALYMKIASWLITHHCSLFGLCILTSHDYLRKIKV